MRAIDNLKEYINEDLIYQDYKKGIENDYLELLERVNRAIDKLICWGEALDPIFQKEMLDILGFKEEMLETLEALEKLENK